MQSSRLAGCLWMDEKCRNQSPRQKVRPEVRRQSMRFQTENPIFLPRVSYGLTWKSRDCPGASGLAPANGWARSSKLAILPFPIADGQINAAGRNVNALHRLLTRVTDTDGERKRRPV